MLPQMLTRNSAALDYTSPAPFVQSGEWQMSFDKADKDNGSDTIPEVKKRQTKRSKKAKSLSEKDSGKNSDESNEKDVDTKIEVEKDKDDKKAPEQEVEQSKDETETSVSKSSEGPSSASSAGGVPPNPNSDSANPPSGGDGGDGSDKNPSKPAASSKPYPPLLAIAMQDKPQLPGTVAYINVSDPAVIKSLDEIVRRKEPHFVLFHMRDSSSNTDIIPSKESVHDIGVHCQIMSVLKQDNGMRILAYPMERCRLDTLVSPLDKKLSTEGLLEQEDFPTSYLKEFGVSYALISECPDEPYEPNSPEIQAAISQSKLLLTELLARLPETTPAVKVISKKLDTPNVLADLISSLTKSSPEQAQEILLEFNVLKRLLKANLLLKLELAAGAIVDESIKELNANAEEAQCKALLKEYLKIVEEKAGLSLKKVAKDAKFEERLKNLRLSEEAMSIYVAEKEKLMNPGEHLAEQSVIEKYLDWITSLPWGVYTKDRFDLKVAREELDRDHFGLKELKNRILEFIAMSRIAGSVDGKILCLVGPPGTGKTSIARSIAEALNRRYARIAVGGIRDVHEIKGHKRTYIGSTPGRIISALKQAKASNPLLLIDEIDKMDLSHGGAASSALLEVLDPEQNVGFVDNYMDMKVDLSKVLFVCTANDLLTITGPLRDRMEIIEVPGYTNNEKLSIAQKHLVPKASLKAGIDPKHISVSSETLEKIIDKYCRESGLRNLKKMITRMFSKASLIIVEKLDEAAADQVKEETKSDKEETETMKGEDSASLTDSVETSVEPSATKKKLKNSKAEPEARLFEEDELQAEPLEIPEDIKIEITPENLKDFLGTETYVHSRMYDTLPPGVSTGLSYNNSGSGDILHIESIITNSIASATGQPGINTTGHLGDMMKESSQIAYSFARLFMAQNYPDNKFFEAAEIHINCPEGAIPKEGPSAGVAFVSSLLSLATNESLPRNIAMTGEISLTGRVLPVGGLREKILGAKRNGCDKVIFPKSIENTLDDITDEVKKGVTLVPVEWYHEVFDILFENMDKEKFGKAWAADFAKRKELKDLKND